MKIILWKLGSLEQKIFPTQTAIMKLQDMISKLDSEKTNHVIWGPELYVQVVDVENLEELDHYMLVYKAGETSRSESREISP